MDAVEPRTIGFEPLQGHGQLGIAEGAIEVGIEVAVDRGFGTVGGLFEGVAAAEGEGGGGDEGFGDGGTEYEKRHIVIEPAVAGFGTSGRIAPARDGDPFEFFCFDLLFFAIEHGRVEFLQGGFGGAAIAGLGHQHDAKGLSVRGGHQSQGKFTLHPAQEILFPTHADGFFQAFGENLWIDRLDWIGEIVLAIVGPELLEVAAGEHGDRFGREAIGQEFSGVSNREFTFAVGFEPGDVAEGDAFRFQGGDHGPALALLDPVVVLVTEFLVEIRGGAGDAGGDVAVEAGKGALGLDLA